MLVKFPTPFQCTALFTGMYRRGFFLFCRIGKKIGLYQNLSLHLLLLSILTYSFLIHFAGESNFTRLNNYKIIFVLPAALLWQSFLCWTSNFKARLAAFAVMSGTLIYWLADKNNLHPAVAFDILSLILAFFIFRKMSGTSMWKKLGVLFLFISSNILFAYWMHSYFIAGPFQNVRPLLFLTLLPFLFLQSPQESFFISTHFFNLINTSPSKNMKLSKIETLNANKGIYLYYFVLLHIVLFIGFLNFLSPNLPNNFQQYIQLYVLSYCAGNIPIVFFRLNRFRALDAFEVPIFSSSLQSHWQRWNRNFYDWMISFIYFPVYKRFRSEFISILIVFSFTYLCHAQGSFLNPIFSNDFLFSGFSREVNEYAFFILNGLFLYFNIRLGRWRIFDAKSLSGWWGVCLVHLFYLSICGLKF